MTDRETSMQMVIQNYKLRQEKIDEERHSWVNRETERGFFNAKQRLDKESRDAYMYLIRNVGFDANDNPNFVREEIIKPTLIQTFVFLGDAKRLVEEKQLFGEERLVFEILEQMSGVEGFLPDSVREGIEEIRGLF